MDATDIVARVARAIEEQNLEAVLIGNAAAALHGAPVTTVDLDFFIRRAPANKRKLAGVAKTLGATLYQPFYPASRVIRMMNDDETLQVDFMDEVSGIRSFEGIRKRARPVPVGSAMVRVAALADIIKSKRARTGRAISRCSRFWRRRLKRSRPTRKERLAQLKAQSEWLENDMIRRRVEAPLERRMNFLRRRVGICRSCL
ncbi:MAG: nucleotidyltransferase [Bryobacteraceae bacterium]